ncbi:hypothetical protein SERLA73DRAFT_169293 [Serpula lacrymans var. lacrymans S7.3]|uniref:Uncharacterized protein n=2 Tax=Serpula lacrymans var. lacrymans TaxID=341189 RepID=F8PZH5_SERL3|nr:hypothetical protein SERLA73DRAFT_169293 [Serpula lacrymans var. lacrymans S7.3]
MHAQRFVNLAPLSLLANTVGTWFKDVRTHPPIVFTFPPPGDGSSQQGGVNEGITFSENLFYSRNPGPPTKTISLQGLLQGVSPYASLDVTRFTAFSPSWRATFNHTANQDMVHLNAYAKDYDACDETNIQPPGSPTSVHTASSLFSTPPSLGSFKSRLPNAMLEVDLRSLNLHLMMRVKEILACAEAMWEWIVDYQEHLRSGSVTSQRAQGLGATGGDGVSKTDTGGQDPIKAAIAGMTRSDFDDLLIQFEM